MKMRKILLLAIISLFLLSQNVIAADYSNYPQKFWDVSKDHWAYNYISELVDKHVISGYDDGSFKPEKTVSRAEWSKMLVIASGKQPISLEGNKSYAIDYKYTDWYYGYINSVVSYMNFYTDNGNYYFKPNQSASREDVTVSLVKLKGYDVNNADYSYITKFKDSNSISNELKKYVTVAIEKGLISGYEDSTFRGQDTLTRAEAATLLCRAFQLGNDNKTTTSVNAYLDISKNNQDINNNTDNKTNKEEPKNDSNGESSDSKHTSGNTIINNNNTTINNTVNNTTINNNNVNINNNTINNNSSNVSIKEEIKTNDEIKEENVVETQKENKLPYKIETLIKANIKNEFYETGPINFVTMKNNILYFLENNIIYALNINTRERVKIMNLDDSISVGQTKYVIKNAYNLFYDKNKDKVFIYCYARKINQITGTDEIANIIVNVEDKILITDTATNIILDDNILSINEDGDFWTNENVQIHLYSQDKILGTKNTFTTEEMNSWDVTKISYTFDMKEINGNAYFLTNDGIYQYDYSEFKNILKTYFNPIAASKNGFIIQDANGDFKKVDVNGKISDYISLSNIEVKDKKSMITSKTIMNKMFVNSNNEIILYDLKNQCFRIISKNK